ncbi:MAG TPA: isoprenylcysteine carboxylmethyltransferase family protein, partial [Acidobacteriaceae bacterium]|nr:isoprenylcysteine carboxylmethyltransferase family protein [Acidobacteriaceae bacterium]
SVRIVERNGGDNFRRQRVRTILRAPQPIAMRWLIFLLLLHGALFCASALAPAAAGHAGLLWPFAVDTRPIIGGPSLGFGAHAALPVLLLAGLALLAFLASLAGLFWRSMPASRCSLLVAIAIGASLPLYVGFADRWMIVPMAVDGVLLWGVVAGRWTSAMLRMREIQAMAAPMHPLMRIPVPWMFVLTYLLGLGLQLLLPISMPAPPASTGIRIAGLVLTAAGLTLAFGSLGIFRKMRTTTVPFEQPALLVTHGPYGLSRNPMYVGLTVLYLGVAASRLELGPVLLLPFFLAFYMNRVIIPMEEGSLRQTFGESYEVYRARVRRWI